MKVKVTKTPVYAAGGYIQDVTPRTRKEGKMMITEEIPNNLGYGVPSPVVPVPKPALPAKRIRYEKLSTGDGRTVFSPVFEGNWSEGEIRNSWNQIPKSFGNNEVLRGQAWQDMQGANKYGTTVKPRAAIRPVFTGTTQGGGSYVDTWKEKNTKGAAMAGGGRVRKPKSDRFTSLVGYAAGGNVDCPDCPHGGNYAYGGRLPKYQTGGYTGMGPYEEEVPYSPYPGTPPLGYGYDFGTDPNIMNPDIYPVDYGPIIYDGDPNSPSAYDTVMNSPWGRPINNWNNWAPRTGPNPSRFDLPDNGMPAAATSGTFGSPQSPLEIEGAVVSAPKPPPAYVAPDNYPALSDLSAVTPESPYGVAGNPYAYSPTWRMPPATGLPSVSEKLEMNKVRNFNEALALANPWQIPGNETQGQAVNYEANRRARQAAAYQNPFRFDQTPVPENTVPPVLERTSQLSGWGNPYYRSVPGAAPARQTASPNLGTTMGDVIGGLGTALGTLGPLWSTIKNRRGDKPHENFYKRFGLEGLESNRLAQEASAKAGSAARLNARIAANTARAANRGSTSSLNVLRGLDTITDIQNDLANAGIESSEAQRMMALLQQRAAQQNERDKMVMTGEEARDLGDRRDGDAYFSALSKNLSDAGTSIQNFGKQLNRQAMNQQEMDLLNMMSRYGFNVRVDNGRLVATNAKGETTELGG